MHHCLLSLTVSLKGERSRWKACSSVSQGMKAGRLKRILISQTRSYLCQLIRCDFSPFVFVSGLSKQTRKSRASATGWKRKTYVLCVKFARETLVSKVTAGDYLLNLCVKLFTTQRYPNPQQKCKRDAWWGRVLPSQMTPEHHTSWRCNSHLPQGFFFFLLASWWQQLDVHVLVWSS